MTEITQHETSIYEERRVSIRIEGAETMAARHTTGRFQPQGLIITYVKSNGEPWTVMSIQAHGPKLKTGGALSTVGAKYVWYPRDERPEWVQTFVDRYLPTPLPNA